RKSWKMTACEKGNVCPHCGKAVFEMGRSFKAPRKSDTEQWQKGQFDANGLNAFQQFAQFAA
ncbi:hypothetical protein, partial [Roseinatronobacter alkalisoli]